MAGQITNVLPDPVLTALAVEFGAGGPFIADRIAPVATVQKDIFKYAKWGREDIKLDTKSSRAPGNPASEIVFAKTFVDSAVQYRSLSSRIADEMRNNDPNPGSLNSRRVKLLTNKLRLEVEKNVAAALAAATNTSAAPGTKWDAANPTIRKNILDDKETFRRQFGGSPNVVVLPPLVASVVFNDSSILDLLKYTNGGLLANGMIPQIEGMMVLSPGAIIDSSNPGASASIGDVYASDEVYYLYVDPSAGNDLEAQTSLRQVRSLATTGTAFAAYLWRDPNVSAHCDWAAVECNQIELVISQEMILRRLDVLT